MLCFAIMLCVLLLLNSHDTFSQNGVGGIQTATQNVKNFFKYGGDLMYAIGGLIGLVGAVKVYQKWSQGDQDTGKVAASWFGACVFLVVVIVILRSFFGI